VNDTDITALTDKELVWYAIFERKLTPLELELVLRLESLLFDDYEFPQWVIDLIEDDEETPDFLKNMTH
jgi:hypothetical protein